MPQGYCHRRRRDGGGRRAEAAVPGDPGADSGAANAPGGAAMITGIVETAGGCGGDGAGLPVLGPNARRKRVPGTITDRQRLGAASRKRRRWLPISRIEIQSSERPTTGVGRKASGEYRMIVVAQSVWARGWSPNCQFAVANRSACARALAGLRSPCRRKPSMSRRIPSEAAGSESCGGSWVGLRTEARAEPRGRARQEVQQWSQELQNGWPC